jgi:two-component system OmpR family response regulator
MKLLLIEDDLVLGKALQKGLLEASHQCHWAQNGQEGWEQIQKPPIDVVILDLMLPDVPGLEILRRARAAGITIPVLVLTALGSVDERVAGLNAGADDYLVKPFAFVELIARLDALGRRINGRPRTSLSEGPISLDLTTRRVLRDDKEIDLTPTEFTLLEFLMRHSNQVVTRRMLCEHLWDSDWEGVTNVIEVHINRLRTKIDRGFGKPLIHTVRGIGYAFRTT